MVDISQNKVKVSIVTVVFNARLTIEKTIKSVLDQNYNRIEYIIIDGGSTDGSIEIIKKYEQQLYKWVSEPDRGISHAFNKGIKLATGDIIGIINADDWYEPDAIHKIVKNYLNNEVIICGKVRLFKTEIKSAIKTSTLKNIKVQMQIWHPGVFVPKNIYNAVGLYNEDIKILMDYDFVARCLESNVRFKFIPDIISNMRAGGVSHQFIVKSMKESLKIKNKYFGKKVIHYFEYLYFSSYYSLLLKVRNIYYSNGK